MRDINEQLRLRDPKLHEVDEVRPAAEECASGCLGQHRDGSGRITCTFVAERLHSSTSLFRSPTHSLRSGKTPLPFLCFASDDRIGSTSAMAGTIFALSAHRQRLPLMRSRISSSLSVTCSAFKSALTALGQPASTSRSIPAAEQICPGVQ